MTTLRPTKNRVTVRDRPSTSRTRQVAVALVAVLVAAGPAAGQGAARPAAGPPSFVSRNWTVDDGLPVNAVTGVAQGRDGYLWLTTYAGLLRFDGVRFTPFTSETTPGLPSDRLLDLVPARGGALWILTERLDLVRFDPVAGTFEPFTAGLEGTQTRTVFEEPGGALWVGTNVGLFRRRGRRFVRVARPALDVGIFGIAADRDGALWVATEGQGVVRLRDGRARRFSVADGLPSDWADAVHVSADGAVWAGTAAGLGLYRAGRFVRVPAVPPERVLAVTDGPGGRVEARTTGGVYAARAEPERGGAVPRPQGLGRWNYVGTAVAYDGRRVFETGSEVLGAALDREGSLWAATKSDGLYRLRPALFTVYSEPEGLPDRYVYSVLEDRVGALWFGTPAAGLGRPAGGPVVAVREPALASNGVQATYEDRAGRLWVGHDVGVCRFSGPRCVPVPGLALPSVRAVLQDRTGAFWFASEKALCRWTEGREAWCLTAADGLPDAMIRVVRETADGALWVGTESGLARLHAGHLCVFTTADGLSGNVVRSLHESADGALWVGTGGRGLNRLTGHAGGADPEIRAVRALDGLADDVVVALVEDRSGRLWMSTNRGIAWAWRRDLDAVAHGRAARVYSTVYTEADGLRNREGNGSQRGALLARDGRLWFATQDGAAVVDPAALGDARGAAVPVVVENVTSGESTWTARGPVRLGARQRNFEVAYTALAFAAPEAVRFRYRLDGFDRAWVEAGARRTAFYTNVPPGRYTFRVAARGRDGRWTAASPLAVSVAPFGYETGAFRVLSGVLVLGAALALVRWRTRTLRHRAGALGREVEARTRDLVARTDDLTAANAVVSSQAESLREMDAAKNRLFANLSHEFRTPLTLILGPLQSGADGAYGPLPEPVRARDALMLRNGRRLLRLVNQVLDLARLEAGGMHAHVAPHALPAFVRQTALAFVPLAEREGVALTVETDGAPAEAVFDREQMERVVGNLLSNALKFTPRGGRVTVACSAVQPDAGGDGQAGRAPGSSPVRVQAAGQAIEVVVSDTGIGIAAEHIAHVFDRFFQVDATVTRAREGSGIGLALARELVELHGGTLTAESEPGAGSRFTVRLPQPEVLAEALALGGPAVPEEPPDRPAAGPAAVDTEGVATEPVDAAPSAETPGTAEAAGEPDRTTVLVVDDNADLRAYLRHVLEPDYRVVEAADGAEALALARAALPDLVVADVMMPVLDGLAFCRALRADPATDGVPVVLLTARSETADELAGLATGADDYVTKPFAPEALRARVGNLIALRQRLRERLRAEGVPPAEAPAEPPFTAAVRAAVLAHLTDGAFTVEALAAEVALSYSQLHRRLTAEAGLAPRDFVRTVRLDAAARLLEGGSGTVSEVAYAVGFNSLAHFSRAFRAQFGTPPSAYAESVR